MASKRASSIRTASFCLTLAVAATLATDSSLAESPASVCRSGRTTSDQQTVVDACTRLAETTTNPAEKAEAFMRRGYAQQMLSDFNGAMASWDLAIAADPKSPDAYVAKGEWLVLSNDFPNAIDLMEKALEHTPNSVGVWTGLARAYQGLGRFEEADKAYGKAITLDSRDMLANFYAAQFAEQFKQFELAAHHYELAAEKWNWQTGGAGLGLMGISDPLRGAAAALGQLGRGKDAVALLTKRVESMPPQAVDGMLLAERGKLYMQIGQNAEAADDLKKAIALLPPELSKGLEGQLSLALRNSGNDAEANDRFAAVLDGGTLQEILRLQVFLRNRGYGDVTINGKPDAHTRTAVDACLRELSCTSSAGGAL
jgi:tetratricopeptide (TPR) repeat protein